MANAPTSSHGDKAAGSSMKASVRSSLTGRRVMMPASKAGRITISEARDAIKSIRQPKK